VLRLSPKHAKALFMAVSSSACSGLIQSYSPIRHVPPLLPKVITIRVMIVSSAFSEQIQKHGQRWEWLPPPPFWAYLKSSSARPCVASSSKNVLIKARWLSLPPSGSNADGYQSMSQLWVPNSTLKPTLDCCLPKTGAKPSMFCVLLSSSKTSSKLRTWLCLQLSWL